MKDKAKYPAGVQAEDFEFAQAGREQVDKIMKASGAKSDTQLATVLRKKTKSILTLDPYIVAEIAEYEALCGSGSERRLMNTVLNMMPTELQAKSPEDVAQALAHLMKSQQFNYAAQSGQGKVTAVQKWVSRVVGDQPPGMALASDCEHLSEIASKFQFFLRHQAKTGKGVKALHGAEALEAKYDDLAPKINKSVATVADNLLAELTPLVVFRYLGSKDLQLLIDTAVAAVDQELAKKLKAEGGTAGCGSASSTAPGLASGKAGNKAGKKSPAPFVVADDSAKAAKKAMALFGC